MTEPAAAAFIARWGSGTSHGGNERANLQMFILELCALLDLPPPDEGRPPFIVDVGRSFTLYAEFSRSGGHYAAFPDARRHTLRLEQLRDPEIRARLRALWLDPSRRVGQSGRRATPQRCRTFITDLRGAGSSLGRFR